MLEYALSLAKTGFLVLPIYEMKNGKCSCSKGKCTSQGKHPRIGAWQKNATANKETIKQWWTAWPKANIGVVFGNGIVDIETDVKNDGDSNLQKLEAKLSPLPQTESFTSGGGGTHRIFQIKRDVRNTVNLGSELLGFDTGIDVRGKNGYAVFPPSNHLSGTHYCWNNENLENFAPAPLPADWTKLLSSKKE